MIKKFYKKYKKWIYKLSPILVFAIIVPVAVVVAKGKEGTQVDVEKDMAYIKFRGAVEYENYFLPVPKHMSVYEASLRFDLKNEADLNNYKIYFGSSNVGITNDRIVEDGRTYFIAKK